MSGFKKLGIGDIENGKAVELIDEYIDITAKDLFKMIDHYKADPSKLKGKISINIFISPLNIEGGEEHYKIGTEISRSLPKLQSGSLAMNRDNEGLYVEERGSDEMSPLQSTIDYDPEQEESSKEEPDEVVDKSEIGVIKLNQG